MKSPPPISPARFPAGPKIREWARQHGFSDWLVARLIQLTDDPSRMLEGLLHRPPRYLRTNPLRIRPDDLALRLENKGFQLSRNDLDPNIFRLRHSPISAGATVEHMLGMSTPQDLASASAPLALQAQRGDIVADLAAAPGVKTLHLAGDLGDKGAIVAVEPDAGRMRALRFNLERCGVTSALLRQETAQVLPGEAWADKVLLDAPCTGEGTLPKDPKRRQEKPEEIVQACGVQAELLVAADRILKPGGTLVYATCTFAPEENEYQVDQLVKRGYTVESLPFDRLGGEKLRPGVTSWPGFEFQSKRRQGASLHPWRSSNPWLLCRTVTQESARYNMSSIRNATHDEATEVLAFYEGLETGLSARVGGDHDIIISERDGIPFACIATHQLMLLPKEVVAGATAAGLPIGIIEDGQFNLDLQGAVLSSFQSKAQTLRVTEHAARLFLYGRNVLSESVLWADPSLDKGDACIVCNPRGEAMGIGTVVGSFKGKGEAVHPVHDLGTYLRDQDE